MKRRHFLQFSGSALAAMGLSQTEFLRQGNRVGQALAQNTPRKLALLVGINSYTDPDVDNLRGCLNDIEMQYQLLVHRFGFKPQDVVKVSDDGDLSPTRANILQAFEEHLIQQARPGDVVVFHYSGHGSRVVDPDPIEVKLCGANSNPEGLNGTLVPNDAKAADQTGSDIVVPDIMGRSLFLLMERVPTDNLTVVLDSCFSGSGTRGNATVRSTSRLTRDGERLLPSPEELEFQERWLQELNISAEEFQRRRQQGIAKGLAVGSASCDQLAFELPYDTGKSAGTFTYLLTSYLWQMPGQESAAIVSGNLTRSTKIAAQTWGDQAPIFEVAPGSDNLDRPMYFTAPAAPFADGVVQTVSGNQLTCWLGGVSYPNLKNADQGAKYELLNPVNGAVQGQVEIASRQGLVAQGQVATGQGNLQPGLLLREKVVAIANPALRLGVDSSLAGQSRSATTSLESVLGDSGGSSRITVLPLDQQANIEYVLARTTPEIQQQLQAAGETDLPPIGSIALFTPDLGSVVPETAGPAGETAEAAVTRLQPRFKGLLVARVLRDLANTSSDLEISGEVFTSSGQGPRIPIASRAIQSRSANAAVAATPAPYRAGDTIQIQVQNSERDAVFLSCLAIANNGDIVVLHPANWNAPDEAARIDAQERLLVPRADDGVVFRVSGAGFIELITIVSKTPLRSLLRGLQTIAQTRGQSRGAVGLEEGDPLSIMDDILGDVDTVSRGAGITVESVPSDRSAVSANAIAAFSTIIEVAE